MRVLAAKDAVGPTAFVRALFRHVPKLLTVPALYRWIRLDVVAGHLVFEPGEHIIIAEFVIFASLLHRLMTDVAVRGDQFLLVGIDVPAEVHIALDGSAWDYQVRITLRIHRRDIVVAVVATS